MTDPHSPHQKPSSSPSPTTIVLIALGLLATLGVSMAVVYLVASQALDPRAAAGDLGAAASRTESSRAPATERGEAPGDEPAGDEPGPYVPSSAYIEAGADSRVLQFGFGGAEGRTDGQRDGAGGWIMSHDTIQSVMSQNQHELVGCYADALQDDPELAGKVDFEFAVAPDGHVAMVRVTRSTLRSPTAEDCFVEHARHWRFPPTDQELLTRFETNFAFGAY